MFYIRIAFVILFLLNLKTMSQNKSKIFPYKVNEFTLSNGLKVISIPYDSKGIVAYYTVVRTGSRNEVEDGKSGFAHFFEHMMFRGTEKYSTKAYNEIVKKLGSDANAFTTDDWTCYHLVASSSALETIMDIESDRFQNLKYSVEGFKTESGAILGEYNKSYSNPIMTMFEKMQEAAFTTHTYKHTTMGFLKDIQDMPNQYEYSLQFFDRYYRPENCIVVVVGDFDQSKLELLANKYYGNWMRGNFNVEIPNEPQQTEPKFVDMKWNSKTLPMLMIGFHSPAFSDSEIDMPTMDLISQLYFSENSKLFQKLVIEEQLVEFVEGSGSDNRDPSMFIVLTRVKDKSNIEKVKEEISKTIEEIKTNPVSKEELEKVKSHLKYSFAMRMNTPDAIANTLSHYLQLTGNYESLNRVYELYEKITADDIIRIAQKYLTLNNSTTLTLTEEETK